MFVLVVQQVIQIARTGRRMRINPRTRALARSGIIQPKERRSADRGRIVGDTGRRRHFSSSRPRGSSRRSDRWSRRALWGGRRDCGRGQHRSAAHAAVAVRVRIFIAAASAAHQALQLPSFRASELPSIAYDILRVRCRKNGEESIRKIKILRRQNSAHPA